MSGNRYRFGALRDLYTRPFYRTLNSSSESSGELLFDTASAHLDALMGNERSAVFVPPVDFAQNSSGMLLYPDIAVASSGHSGVCRLYLRRDLALIRTMAVGQVSTTDVVLARIVLAEKYDAEPAIVPVIGSVDDMLAKADCALIAGDALLTLRSEHPFIDMADEWSDITELPFVHTVCITRSDIYVPDVGAVLRSSMEAGTSSLSSIVDQIAAETGHPADLLSHYFSRFQYGLQDDARASLEEFFRMAFYHGMLGDVPEINVGP